MLAAAGGFAGAACSRRCGAARGRTETELAGAGEAVGIDVELASGTISGVAPASATTFGGVATARGTVAVAPATLAAGGRVVAAGAALGGLAAEAVGFVSGVAGRKTNASPAATASTPPPTSAVRCLRGGTGAGALGTPTVGGTATNGVCITAVAANAPRESSDESVSSFPELAITRRSSLASSRAD